MGLVPVKVYPEAHVEVVVQHELDIVIVGEIYFSTVHHY